MRIAIALSALAILTSTLSASALPNTDTEIAINPAVDNGTALPLTRGEGRGKGLNLTDEQREQIFALKNKMKDDLGPKQAELQKERRALQDLLTKATLDRDAIQKTHDRITALKNEMSDRHLAFALDFHEKLTPEQRETFRLRQMKHSTMKGRGHHHRRHGGHGPRIGTESGGAVNTSLQATGSLVSESSKI